MENSKLKRAVALVLSVMMVFCLFAAANPALYATNAVAEEDNSTTDEALEILKDTKWAKYKEKYASTPVYKGEPITVNSSAADLSKGGEITDYLGHTNVVFVSDTGSVSWTINVPETGLYALDILYSYLGSDDKRAKAADIERTLRVDGKVPYTELRNLVFTKKWVDNFDGIVVDKDEYGNMVQKGIIDPTKVSRSALQNAASIAGLLLTTDCMVTDLPEKKEGCGCGGHGGAPDMGGMM